MAAIFVGFTAPITAPQILWVNMVTSVALGLVVSFEPHELDVMQQSPRAVDLPILDAFGIGRVVFVGLALLALILSAFFWMKEDGASDALARAVAVNALVIGQIFYLLNSRYKVGSSLLNRPVPPHRAINPFGKVGRNEVCPCGSGRKFKKCCLLNEFDANALPAR